ncbi:asparaginase [Deinococcus psychrotolerans]|uniref:Asparaginase n=1 Tax=Deinococcus psychrotolerans TaxID=2489213 RepID=A0A3G8Y9R0_9DEIO|nr:asparaginase [Deinococcus psychrotolerans]AZI41680.1 asparaginase [Deinococcus psychrotolerans]
MSLSSSRLAVIHTGGTIASRPDPSGAGLTPQQAPQTPISPQIRVDDVQAFNLPSPHITPAHMETLRGLIEDLAPDYGGLVVTHGTDTLEETAFFLHLTLGTPAGVVLTGSMRHAEELSWDGPGNLYDAAQVALSPQTRGRGPLVVFGGDIFDARTVTKVHTTAVDAFGGYPGPIGRIDHGPVGAALHYFARPEPRPLYRPSRVDARVEVLYAYAGWRGEGYAQAAERADGLVIAALGTGNLPAELLPLIEQTCAQTQKPVIIATRTHAGPVLPIYGYAGGGASLLRAGAIPASFLNAHKARILLVVLLGMGLGRDEIAEVFGRF